MPSGLFKVLKRRASGRAVCSVAVDLRRRSPTYGQSVCIELGAQQGNMLYLVSGLAHGFYTLSDTATLVYNLTSVYAPAYDTGIRWDSVGIPWPDKKPILSERDQSFPPLEGFDSPFAFDPTLSKGAHF